MDQRGLHRRSNSEIGSFSFAAHRKNSIERLEKVLVRKGSMYPEDPVLGRAQSMPQIQTDDEIKTYEAPQAMDEEHQIHSILCECWAESPVRYKLELFKAAYLGRLDIVETLVIERGVDPDCFTTLNEHEHKMGCPEDDSNQSSSSKRIHPGPGWPAMCTAAARGHYDIVKFLLKEGAAPDITTVENETRSKVRYFPLYVACAKGHKDIVQLLLRYRSLYNINLVQQQGYNVVIGACMIGNSDPDILKMVIEAGANVNHLDPKGGSAVFLCAQHNRPDFMRILFKYGALPAPKPPTGHDDTMERNSAPIHIAASRNNVGALRVLLEHGAEANQKILSTGATALILSAHSGFVESIQVLIEFDAELDEKDLEGRTALHKCCEHGHLKAAEVLIQSSALVDCIDNKGYTPLMIAVRCGYLALIKVLLAAGANASHTSNRGSSMFDKLFEAIGSGVDLETALEIGELLIKHGANVNGSKSSNHTPLHTACALQNVDVCCGMLKLLLKNGANVNGVDSSGKTALYIAAREGAIEVVTILLNHGAHVESLDAFGSSPLIDCCLSNSSLGKPHIEIAELLISRGADMNLVNSDGLSPLAAAMSSGNFKMITYLVSFTICDLSVLTVCKASRSIMVSSEEKDAIHSAIDAGLRKRSELYFMASVNPRFGRQSILYKHLLKKSMFDRNLLGLMYSFVQYDESVEDESFNDEPLDAA